MDLPRKRHDYGIAQALIAEGLTLRETAEKTGIPYGSLKAKSSRGKWLQIRRRAAAAVRNDQPEIIDWKSRADNWRLELAGLLDKRLQLIKAEHDRKLDLEDMERAGRIIDLIDKTQRRQMGLEDGMNNAVNMQIISKAVDIKTSGGGSS